ncbi:YteA family regulatory protein [Scopulibacillus daqui]|uniref:YteA family regulatory protein n=1 Tax=Scopulibacillus daqui TaxID=1469162 RepID=A0ABS2PY95_9BACL|nr:transcriptional regulator [Scopulibacillus daqui]MBM7644287.1 YteA family regulatory protein [Scopulibacillus daqui]
MRLYEDIKKQLIQRKQELEKQLNINNEFGLEEPFASSEASGELSQYDNHPADSGSALYEREKDLTLRNFAREELEDINAALERMEKGTYGIDEKTGEAIPYARLEALPTARTNVLTSPNQDKAHGRPIEEEVIAQMEEEWATNSDETEYNEQNAYDIVSSFNESSMTYDDSSNLDNEDGMGYVELVEAIGATGIDGYQGDDQVQFLRNIQYDKWMNQESAAEEDEE